VGEEQPSANEACPGWARSEDAYAVATQVLNTLACHRYEVEVFLERLGERYQVVIRSADEELICASQEQAEYLVEQAREG
jgi:hypothetical protein